MDRPCIITSGRPRIDAIEANNLRKSFGTVTAVDDVSITIPEGGIFRFLGPNGAGKTTTIRMLTGVLIRMPARFGSSGRIFTKTRLLRS